MANLYNCLTDKKPYVNPFCPEDSDEKNRVIHVAFVEKGNTVTKTSASAMATSILALEKACKAVIIRNVNGSKADPTTTKGKGFGRQAERTLGKEHVITYSDKSYILNVEFYNSFESNASLYDMYYMTDTYAWQVEKSTLNAEAKDPITDDNKTFMEGMVEIKWNQSGNPVPIKIDTTAFDKPQQLFDVEAASFVNASGSTATISLNSGTISESASTAFEVEMDTSEPIDTVSLLQGALPSGVTIGKDDTGEKLVISGSTAATGSYDLVIQVANECGLTSAVEVTLVIG